MIMKKSLLALVLVATLMTGCGSKTVDKPAEPTTTPETMVVVTPTADPSATPQAKETPKEETTTSTPKTEVVVDTEKPADKPKATGEPTATPAPTAEPTPAPTEAPTAVPTPVSTAAPVAAPAAVSMSYGEVPFNLSAGSDQWWQIDSSDSAYWAVQENINAIRAAGGLGALSMSDGLTASANTRCANFVSGGAFDHSGMITKSEICAQGPIGSASAVCSAWQGSADHYANIMRTDISSMGVGCWFCTVNGNNYTYWVVTFE